MDNIIFKTYTDRDEFKLEGDQYVQNLQQNLQKRYEKYLQPLGITRLYCYLLVDYNREISGGIHISNQNNNVAIKLSNFSKFEGDIKFQSFFATLSGPFIEDLDKFSKENKLKNVLLIISADNPIDFIENLINQRKQQNKEEKDEVNTVFIPITPIFSIEKIVLNDSTKEEILKTITILRQSHILYEEWGFKEVEPLPKAILNFYGPPGTGKTMTAHAIANILGKKILVLNYADIESKFVGDAPKNLVKAFKVAKEEDAVLFFDEADSFLGKRITSVSTSADQAVNSLRSQLLMLLEDFSGIVIFATNLVENYDSAFKSRIFKHIKFDLPDEKLRKELILSMIPGKVPLKKQFEEEEIMELVKLSEGFSGRDIKNCVRDALISAIHDCKNEVDFDYFKNSFQNYRASKLSVDKNLSGEDLGKIKETIKQNLAKQSEN